MSSPETLTVACPVCQAGPGRPCRDLTFALLPGSHVERTETTPLADAVQAQVTAAATDPKAYAGADHGDWSLRAYDDDPEGHQYLRLVWTHKGTVVDEGRCHTYKVWTVLAHWTEDLPELAGADRG